MSKESIIECSKCKKELLRRIDALYIQVETLLNIKADLESKNDLLKEKVKKLNIDKFGDRRSKADEDINA